MSLTQTQRTLAPWALSHASDEFVRSPLWEFSPHIRSAVLHERRRRNIMQDDPEPIGDPEFS